MSEQNTTISEKFAEAGVLLFGGNEVSENKTRNAV
jgi:hypothetical protein